jgi:hypothetical protein
MDAGYKMQYIRALAAFDMLAIEKVKQLKDDVLYVKGIFQRYGITHENCRPRATLRELAHPQSPLEAEVSRFNEAEARIEKAVNDHGLPIPVQSAIAANIEMLYFDPDVTYDNIEKTTSPKI